VRLGVVDAARDVAREINGMNAVSIGIKPGLDGAIAILDFRTDPPTATVCDTPTLSVPGPRGGTRDDYDLAAMAGHLAPYAGVDGAAAFIEIPRDRAAVTLAYSTGLWGGLLAALGIPWRCVAEKQWRRKLSGQTADQSRFDAMCLFPELVRELRARAHRNRGDAMMIAVWGRHQEPDAIKADMLNALRREVLPHVRQQLLKPSPLLETLLNTPEG
jgi:hypothetical protein